MNSPNDDISLLEFSIHPPKGWLRYKRDKFGITGPQLATKMGVSKQRISALEKAELSGAASLKTMRQAAAALGCDFVYALVPKGSLEADDSVIEHQVFDPLECLKSAHCSDLVAEICKLFKIKHLGLYGSAARGKLKDESDINLLAEFATEDYPLDSEIEQMEIQFGRLFARKTNIVSQDILDDEEHVDAIMRDLKLLYLT